MHCPRIIIAVGFSVFFSEPHNFEHSIRLWLRINNTISVCKFQRERNLDDVGRAVEHSCGFAVGESHPKCVVDGVSVCRHMVDVVDALIDRDCIHVDNTVAVAYEQHDVLFNGCSVGVADGERLLLRLIFSFRDRDDKLLWQRVI
jgi:hypothetical protein